MKIRTKYYMHLTHREVKKISTCWNWIHVVVQLGIIITSFMAAWAMSNILQSYDYNCILYAKVQFRTVELAMELNYELNLTDKEEDHSSDFEDLNLNETVHNLIPDMEEFIRKEIQERLKDKENLPGNANLPGKANLPGNANNSKRETASRIVKKEIVENNQPRYEEDYHIDERTGIKLGPRVARKVTEDSELDIYRLPVPDDMARMHIFQNETFRLISELRLRHTIFSTRLTCNLVIIIPLLSMIVSMTFFTIMFFMGSQSELPSMAFCTIPLMITACVMVVFNISTTLVYDGGLETFCEGFEVFTGSNECTPAMDEFCSQFEETPNYPFYIWWQVGRISHYCTLVLWAAQGTLNLLRIVCVSDFDMVLTRIKAKEEQAEDQEEAGMIAETVAKVMMAMRQRKVAETVHEKFTQV